MTDPVPSKACEHCGGSGRLMIYDNALYLGQSCSPIGDEPCPSCQPTECDDCGADQHDGPCEQQP